MLINNSVHSAVEPFLGDCNCCSLPGSHGARPVRFGQKAFNPKVKGKGGGGGGGDVLAAPAERVAGAILEIDVAQFVHDEDVARQEGGVAVPEDVVDNFLGSGLLVGVTVKIADGMVLDDHGDEHARLAGFATNTEALGIANRLAAFVHSNQ